MGFKDCIRYLFRNYYTKNTFKKKYICYYGYERFLIGGGNLVKKHFLIILLLSFFLFVACEYKEKAKIKFDDAQSVLDSSFGESGTERIITGDIELPNSIGDVSLIWTSDKPEILSASGKVNRGEKDVVVTLTVEMKYGANTLERMD